MIGVEFQDKLDAIVVDLQTSGKGQTVQIMFRNPANQPATFQLFSDSAGVVDVGKLAELQTFVDALKPIADTYEVERAPVMAASEAFNLRRATHQSSIDAASAARIALQNELMADAQYQTLSTALDAARLDADYIQATANYKTNNVSENFSELSSAKGKYVI